MEEPRLSCGECLTVLVVMAIIVFLFDASDSSIGFWGLLSVAIILIGILAVILGSSPSKSHYNNLQPPPGKYGNSLDFDARFVKYQNEYNEYLKQLDYPRPMLDFVAIDFETANKQPTSACALGVAIVVGGEIVESKSWLINPVTKSWIFSYLHGITPEMVASAPTFEMIWPEVHDIIKDKWLVAHNMSFDHKVLRALCRKYQLIMPHHNISCTLEMSRRHLSDRLIALNLAQVSEYYGIALQHHDAKSDAEAAAMIALRLTSVKG